MISLYERCCEFEKLAAKISIVENTEPLLRELSDIKDFEDRVAFCKEHFKFLGEGSSRTAFEIDENLIIKVAHNEKGLAQCRVEMDPKAQRPCTLPIVVADAEGKWIILRNTEPLKEKDFKSKVGFGFTSFMNALFYKFNNESDKWNPPRDYDEIVKNPLFNCIAELVFDTDQQIGDCDKIGSWRNLDGEPVLADYGLSRDVYKEYYEDEDDSSSSSSPPKTST
jgi:hypothetical protein